MRRSVLVLPSTAALAAALMLGCADHQSPTLQTASAPAAPGFLKGGNGSGGAIVVRAEEPLGLVFWDFERGLTTVLGNTAAELEGVCAGTVAPETMSILEILRPTGAIKRLWKGHERAVLVWSFISFDLCGELATTIPLAEGTAYFHLTDNDVNVTGPGANSSTTRAVGRVTNPTTGEELKYSLFGRFHLLPGRPFEEARVVSEIRLF